MGDKTGIEWTTSTWNPVSGCSKASQGCKHCYAETIFHRPYPGRDFTDVRTHADRLGQPLKWKAPRRVFVNSMSDLFHEDVPFDFIDQVFAVMAIAPHHKFQILTKRPWRMLHYLTRLHRPDALMLPRQLADAGFRPVTAAWVNIHAAMVGMFERVPMRALNAASDWQDNHYPDGDGFIRCWPLPNVWLGVSVEDQETADERIPLLLRTPAAVRFVSAEPLLGPVDFRFTNGLVHGVDAADYLLGWVIVGGESGPKARPCDVEWIRDIVRQCQAEKVPVFVKQDSARRSGMQGRIPDDLWLKEFPDACEAREA